MSGPYENLAPEDADTLNRLALLLWELRDSRAALLARHGAETEEQLLERIQSGEIPEHPGYDDYLGARTITSNREAIRAELRDFLPQVRVR